MGNRCKRTVLAPTSSGMLVTISGSRGRGGKVVLRGFFPRGMTIIPLKKKFVFDI